VNVVYRLHVKSNYIIELDIKSGLEDVQEILLDEMK